jgi:hypothetical protein
MIALASLVVLLAQAPAAPPTAKPKPVPTGPVVAVETSLGTIKIALFVNEFKSCKADTDIAQQCRDTLTLRNLTEIKFSDGAM